MAKKGLFRNLIIIFILAVTTFFVAKLYFGLSNEFSYLIALFFLLIVGGISLIGFDEFMMLFEGKPSTHGMTPEQKEEYEREIARLKAQSDVDKSEKSKEEMHKHMKELADRIRKRGVLK